MTGGKSKSWNRFKGHSVAEQKTSDLEKEAELWDIETLRMLLSEHWKFIIHPLIVKTSLQANIA